MDSQTISSGPSKMDAGVLLDAGTNEVEILVFLAAGQRFGVNVAKVREVLSIEKVTYIPQTHSAVDGMVRIREWVVPLVNLARYFGSDADECGENSQTLLLLEFNEQLIAFRVQDVERIFRVSWHDTNPLPQITGAKAPVTSVVQLEGKLVQVLDFETIAAVINGDMARSSAANELTVDPSLHKRHPIVLAEDSNTIRKMVLDSLSSSGYTNVRWFADGQDAWEYLQQTSAGATPEDISQKVAAVVTDIEMPRMDGFSLTKRIRDHAVMKDLPVILFSSIVSKDNEKKGRQVGATAKLSKPKYQELSTTLIDVLERTLV